MIAKCVFSVNQARQIFFVTDLNFVFWILHKYINGQFFTVNNINSL